jgi:purine-binding chemotaxis protein CheW
MQSMSHPGTDLSGTYLTVSVAEESYGIAVLKVREIIRFQKITPVPKLPSHVKGVINLRGRVIPIIDLRVKFGLPAQFGSRTCIIVVHVVTVKGNSLQMGLIVDSVEEVVSLTADQIESTPDFGVSVSTHYLLGIAKVNGEVKTLLDVDQMIAANSADTLAALADLRTYESNVPAADLFNRDEGPAA